MDTYVCTFKRLLVCIMHNNGTVLLIAFLFRLKEIIPTQLIIISINYRFQYSSRHYFSAYTFLFQCFPLKETNYRLLLGRKKGMSLLIVMLGKTDFRNFKAVSIKSEALQREKGEALSVIECCFRKCFTVNAFFPVKNFDIWYWNEL